MKSAVIPGILTLIALPASAQTAETPSSFWADPLNHPLFLLYVVGAFVVVAFVLTVMVAIYLLRVLRLLTEEAARAQAAQAGIPYVQPKSLWAKWMEKLNASVPVEREKDIQLDHDYDGIRELDNHLPPWWKALFYGTIGFAVVYLFVYHLTPTLPLSQQEYEREVAIAQENIRKLQANQPQEMVDVDALVFSTDAEIIERGRQVFMNNSCGSCHRNDGGGNTIGPNLTDAYWLHGGAIKNIFQTVNDGVVEKGMPAWGKSLKATDVRDVVFFIMSLQGTNPPDAKAPQGELFEASNNASDTTEIRASL